MPVYFDINMHRHGGSADLDSARVEADYFADADWLLEFHLIHRHRHDCLICVFVGLHATGDIQVAQYDSAKNGAVLIRVSRQQHDSDGRISKLVGLLFRSLFQCFSVCNDQLVE